jgi:hypothetical protein
MEIIKHGISKDKARALAASETFTVGYLKNIIKAAQKALNGFEMSNVNNIVPKKTACDIYYRALGNRQDSEILIMHYKCIYTDRMKKSGDFFLVNNILRDCYY